MSNNTLIEFTDTNFEEEVLKSTQPVIVDFWAPWCGPCKMLTPIIEELAQQFKDSVKIGKLDTDNNPLIATKYAINSIPTLLFLVHGTIKDKVVGVVPKDALISKIQAIITTA